jgi:pimeloyl-ACP methyl ester carboxylesterase
MDVTGLLVVLLIGLVLALAGAAAYTCFVLTHPPRRTFAFALSRNLPPDPSAVRIAEGAGSGLNPGESPSGPEGTLAQRPLEFSSWTFRSRGLDLPVWDVPGRAPGGPTVIASHGWSDSRIVALRVLPALLPHCGRIIMWDLPGHGEAPGVCSLGTREADDLCALVRIAGDEQDRRAPIVLCGASLGAGVSIVAATRGGVAGVIAEAPYRVPIVPARNVMRFSAMPHRVVLPIAMGVLGVRFGYGLSWCRQGWSRRFDRARFAEELEIPLLVLHGSDDPVCPPEDGERIAGAAPQGSFISVPGAAHNNLWTERRFAEVCGAAVGRFLAQFPAAPTPACEGVRPDESVVRGASMP